MLESLSTIAILSIFLLILGLILLLIGIFKKIKWAKISGIIIAVLGIIVYILGFTIQI